jgi:hypothetical protein
MELKKFFDKIYCINLEKRLDRWDKVSVEFEKYGLTNQVHVSIQRAIDDGCEKIYIFGSISDNVYYEKYVKNLIKDNVIFYGQHSNKQEMYNMIGRVYHSSISEVACLVKDECVLTNTKFFGNNSTTNDVSTLKNEEVINKWIKLFEE